MDVVGYLVPTWHPFYEIIEKNKESQKNVQNSKIVNVQAWFDWACSWTVMESARFCPRPVAPA
jgi:hypothetical protein